MGFTHPDIEFTEKFGSLAERDEKIRICMGCGRRLNEDSESYFWDIRGQLFCSRDCRNLLIDEVI